MENLGENVYISNTKAINMRGFNRLTLLNTTIIRDDDDYIYPILNYFFLNVQENSAISILTELGLLELFNKREFLNLITILEFMIGKENPSKSLFFKDMGDRIKDSYTNNINPYERAKYILMSYGNNYKEVVDDLVSNFTDANQNNFTALKKFYFFAYSIIRKYNNYLGAEFVNFHYLFNESYKQFFRECKSNNSSNIENLDTLIATFSINLENNLKSKLYILSNMFKQIFVVNIEDINVQSIKVLPTLSSKYNYLSEKSYTSILRLFKSLNLKLSDNQYDKMDLISEIIKSI